MTCPALAIECSLPSGASTACAILTNLVDLRLVTKRLGFPLVAALSCIYEGDKSISPARKVLKPSPRYGKEEAYNALADLRHLELKLAGATAVHDGEFALCTSDIGLALFWCGLPCALKADGKTFSSSLTPDLFPRLGEQDLVRLGNRLAGR